jgi:hypothetical protein
MKFKNVLLVLAAVLVAIQFIQIDKTNPPYNAEGDFMQMEQPPQNVAHILKGACYDCHSNETKYPWYTSVAPLSWWIKKHINEGRKHLNFSTWADLSEKKKQHKMKEAIEEVEKGEMPLGSYTLMHPEAKLNNSDKALVLDWLKGKYGGNEGHEAEGEHGEGKHD